MSRMANSRDMARRQASEARHGSALSLSSPADLTSGSVTRACRRYIRVCTGVLAWGQLRNTHKEHGKMTKAMIVGFALIVTCNVPAFAEVALFFTR